MQNFPSVWWSDESGCSRRGLFAAEVLRSRGYEPAASIAAADVCVLAGHERPDRLVLDALAGGAGLILLLDGPMSPEAAELAACAGVWAVDDGLPRGGTLVGVRPAGAAGLLPGASSSPSQDEDLLARVDVDLLTPTGALGAAGGAVPFLRLAGTSRDPGAAVAVISAAGPSRTVVLGVEIGPEAGELLLNAVAYAARRRPPGRRRPIAAIAGNPAWLRLKEAVTELRPLQSADGSVQDQPMADGLVGRIITAVEELAPKFPHDADYLNALTKDFRCWSDAGFGVPDFLDSLQAFHPERNRVDGRQHLVVFPMYTQNGNPDRNVEAILVEAIWPDFVAELEAGDYSNKLFVPIRFLDFTPGYDTNSAVLFPETVAMREVPSFSWGAIFADREAARFRKVVTAAAGLTRLALPSDAARMLADQDLAEQVFVMWDLIHDRTHMHGDLPFDPFMIKQRMPYFLYSLEELRCDLTAFRESVILEKQGVPQARLVQYAILFDRIFRFAITGTRVRNYDGLGGQLLFAWLHQHHVLHWTDNRLSIDWSAVTEPVLELGRQIEQLYWQSIDRSKTAHWLAAYSLVSATVAPNPRSVWAKGPDALPLDGPVRGLTDAVLPDEFPLSMFYEALNKKMAPVIASTAGITG